MRDVELREAVQEVDLKLEVPCKACSRVANPGYSINVDVLIHVKLMWFHVERSTQW